MDKNFSNYFKTSDQEQIFYNLNFDPKEVQENVLIFNYGLVCSHHHWQYQIDYFDKLGCPVLIYDYRGHFQSSGSDKIENITFARMTLDLKELITHLNLKNSILLGHSMGVNLCLEFAKKFPSDVNKMILISGSSLPIHNIMMNTHLTGTLKPYILKMYSRFPKEFGLFWKFGGWNPVVKKLIHSGGFNTEQVSDEFIEIYLNKIGRLGPELFFQLIGEMQKHDILAYMAQIKVPSLIIGGNKDKVIPNYVQRLIHQNLEKSELYIIHKGSHVPQVDFYEQVNERIELFI